MAVVSFQWLTGLCGAVLTRRPKRSTFRPGIYHVEALEGRRLLATTVLSTSPHQLDSTPANGAHEAEMATAIDPSNPLHIEAVTFAAPSDAIEYCSTDGGHTWNSSVIADYCYDSPTVAFDPNGDLFIGMKTGTLYAGVFVRWAGETFPNFHAPVSAAPGGTVDKTAVAVGFDPVHNDQALYLMTKSPGSLTGWDIVPGTELTNQETIGTAVNSWGAPVVSPSGDVYLSDSIGNTARLNGGLWAASPTWIDVNWPNPAAPNALTLDNVLGDPVPASPNHPIFSNPTLAMAPGGQLFMSYAIADPGFVSGSNSQTPYTSIYVVSCANPGSSSPTWGTPVAVDSNTNVTEFMPALSVDPLTGTIGVVYYTTSGTPDLHTAVMRFAFSEAGGAAGSWSGKIISPGLESNMYQYDASTGDNYDYLEYIGLDMRGGAAQAVWASASTNSPLTGTYAYTSRIAVSNSAYASTVVMDSPAIYWRLNEVTGTTAQDPVDAADSGTYSGSFTQNVEPLVSHDDFARSISTGSDTVLSNFVYKTNAVSVEAWVMLTASGASGAICGFANGPGSGNYDKDLYVSPAGQLVWYVWDGQVETVIGPVLNPHQVYHIVGTFDGATMHLYVNGTDVGQAPASSSYQGYVNDDVMVGGGTGGIPNTLSALVSEFAVYGYPLSPTRVLAHYDAGLAPYAGLVIADAPAAYWRLDEQSGATAADSSGNSLNGSYSGSYSLDVTGALQNSTDTAALFNGGTASGGGLGANGTADPITVECWVDPESAEALVFEKGSGGGAAYGISLDRGQVIAEPGGYSGAYVPQDQWSYVAVVYYPNGPTDVYVNGALAGHGGYSPAADTTGTWQIGGAYTTELVDEAAIYKYAMSASEVRQHYLAGCPTYKETVIYDSPAIYWRLDEPSVTTAYDDSNTNTTGAYSGTYTQSQTGALSLDSDPAVNFNGGSVTMNDNFVLQYPSASVEAWVRLNAVPTANALVAGFGDLYQYDKDLYVDPNGHIDWMVNDGTQKVITDPVLSTGQWYHLVGTVGGGAMALYVDGQQVGTQAAGSTLTGYAQYDVHVAGGVPGLESINAAVDEFALYDHALSWPQVAKHHTVAMSYYATAVLGDSPVAYWQLNDTGTPALDATGNGATGTYGTGVTHGTTGAQFCGTGGVSGSGLIANSANDTYTVEAWVDIGSNGGQGCIFAKGATQSSVAFGVGLSEYSPYGQAIGLLVGNAYYSTPYIVPTGRSYIACVFSPSGADIYINGKHVVTLSSCHLAADSSGDWSIGGDVPVASYDNFTGTIDDVAVYNYGLTADQIMRHYMIGLGYSLPS